jgi:hypothetical protein
MADLINKAAVIAKIDRLIQTAKENALKLHLSPLYKAQVSALELVREDVNALPARRVKDNRAELLNRFLDDWEDELPAEMVAELHSVVAGIDPQIGPELAEASKPYMDQTMAECGCERRGECDAAGRCLAVKPAPAQGVDASLIVRANKLADDMERHATDEWDESELVRKLIAALEPVDTLVKAGTNLRGFVSVFGGGDPVVKIALSEWDDALAAYQGNVVSQKTDDPLNWIDIEHEKPPYGQRVLFGYCEGSAPGDYSCGRVAIGALYKGHSTIDKLWFDNALDNEKVWPTHWKPLEEAPTVVRKGSK